MGKSLVVVESPAKATTINKILGRDFIVKSCMGHVRDLPPKELGVDVDKDFLPRYVTIRGKGKILTDLRRAAQRADTIYLATDPDREGEAIAWHVAQAIAAKDGEVKRILFNEITPKAVRESINRSGVLDLCKVNAQQARRVLDRLVGYEISPLLWKVIHAGLSAGRVQSVALRLICERDAEIASFEPQEYWSIDALLGHATDDGEVAFKSRLLQYEGKKLEIPDQKATDRITAALRESTFTVKSIKHREQRRRAAPPFITSTLQQEAARKLRFSVKRTMAVAQQLYEGIELVGETVGLITYMRTDSVRVADEAIEEVRAEIGSRFGKEYVPGKPIVYKTRRGAQDAHEAIRPTSVERSPEEMKSRLSPDQWRLYELIWKRFLASQMEPQVMNIISVDIAAGDYLLRATGSQVKFPGFTVLYTESKEDEDEEESTQVPADLTEGETLTLKKLLPEQHFTKPPPRYSEASLVKELEAKGIGRPSTYAQIISTLQDREYVEKMDNRYFEATERGQTVNKLLVATFPNIFDVAFTARMEDELDRIEDGREDWVASVRQFLRLVEGVSRGGQRAPQGTEAVPPGGDRHPLPGVRTQHGRQVGPERPLPRLPGLPAVQEHEAPGRAARAGGDRRGLRPVLEAHGREDGALRPFPRLLRVSRLPQRQALLPGHLLPGLRGGRHGGEAVAQGQSVLWLRPLPEVQVRQLGQAGGRPLPAVRGAPALREGQPHRSALPPLQSLRQPLREHPGRLIQGGVPAAHP